MGAALIQSLTTVILLFLCSTLNFSVANSEAGGGGGGLAVQLIHRDSSIPPSDSPPQRHANPVRRSIDCLHRFTAAESKLTADGGEYLMKISIGTPPFPILAVVDTRSDVVWTQCKPCPNCYAQNAPLFDPSASRTYKTVPCSSKACSSLRDSEAFCSPNDAVCHYQVGYGEQSHSDGDLALETLTLGSTAFPKMLIGCGHNNAGSFSSNSSGVIGLGGGPGSLVTQLGSSIDYKFSYCLGKSGAGKFTGTMNFGRDAALSGDGRGVVFTKLISDSTKPTYYFLKLESVSVGNKKIPFEAGSPSFGSSNGKGNIIVDSGTALTIFPTKFFSLFSRTVEGQIVGAKKVEDPHGYLTLCYVVGRGGLKVPRITMHFEGADVALSSANVFIHVSDAVTCLAFYGSDGASIYGNVAQQNFLIGYDLRRRTLSFKPTDCARN